MALNYAKKYSSKIDERFKLESFTEIGLNKGYDWNGVDTVTVFGVDTVALNDYTKSGTSRYGTPADLGNTVQTLLLTQDKSFTFVIDKGTKNDTLSVMDAGEALKREIDEVVIPAIDIYRLASWVTGAVANGKTATLATTKDNIYEKFLDAQASLDNSKVNMKGRIAYFNPYAYNKIKMSGFVTDSDLGQGIKQKGTVGDIDGVKIVRIPSSYLPANVTFLLVHPVALVAPVKMTDYTTHNNPPGINGMLCEGRFRHDSFILNNKKDALFVHKEA